MNRDREEFEAARLAHAEALHEVWDTLADWWTVCPKCGQRVRGTPKTLREHVCGSTDL